MIPIIRHNRPLHARYQHRQIPNDVRARDRRWKRHVLQRAPSEFEREDAGAGEAVEEDEGGEVALDVVLVVSVFVEDEGGGEEVHGDFEEGGERGLCVAAEEALDLETRVQVVEVGAYHAEGGAGLEGAPDGFEVVGVVF